MNTFGKTAQAVVTFLTMSIEVALIARIITFLVGAAGSPSLQSIVTVTQPLIAPFIVFFPEPAVRGQMVVEFAALAAVFVYAVLGYVLQQLIRLLLHLLVRPPTQSAL